MSSGKIFELINEEKKRQSEVLEMIPSENYVSEDVLNALGSVLVNKYSEGYPGKRYYQGNSVIDSIETYTQELAKDLFNVPYANVQPYSGSPANAAIYMATLQPGQKIMGLELSHGGHITHGLEEIGFSGKFFKVAHYSLSKETGQLDYDEVEKKVLEEKPDLLICGFTAYPGIIDFKRFGEIADKAGCLLLADISHIAGLIIGGAHPSPSEYVDIIMTTTHKSLRGPRGAIIMVTQKGLEKDPDLPKKIDSAVFPGLQGGPHNNQTAAIAVSLEEASTEDFKLYTKQIVKNSQKLAEELIKNGLNLVSGGSENHLILIDLKDRNLSGKIAAEALEEAGIVVNFNLVPYDPLPPFYSSGIRLGTPAITSRGMREEEMVKIAGWICDVIKEVENYKLPEDKRGDFLKNFREEISQNQKLKQIKEEVKSLTQNFPVPGIR